MVSKIKIKRSLSPFNLHFSLRWFFSFLFVTLMLVAVGVGIMNLSRGRKMEAEAESVSVSLLGPAGGVFTNVGQEFVVDTFVNTNGLRISAADLKVKYDSNIIEGVGVENIGFLPVTLVTGRVDNSRGVASIVIGSAPDNPKSGSAVLARFRFRLKNNSLPSTTISLYNSGEYASAVAAIGYNSNVISSPASLTLRVSDTASCGAYDIDVSRRTWKCGAGGVKGAGCGPGYTCKKRTWSNDPSKLCKCAL